MAEGSEPSLPPLAPERARRIVGGLSSVSLLVVGDVMLDRFVVGNVTRISPEAPVPVVRFSHDVRAGGAANVALNVRALGGGVELVGVIGTDADGDRLAQTCAASGVGIRGLVLDESRRTTTKMRVVTGRNQQVARIDYEADEEITGRIEQAVISALEARVAGAQVILVSDYLKGVVTGALMARAIALGHEHGVPVLVDPKVPHIGSYAGATLVTPNHHEAETATHMRVRSDVEARRAARAFRTTARCEAVLMTRGDQGMWLLTDTAEGKLAATAREVADVTGAGDTVIATMALALAAGASMTEAAQLANEAAGLVVARFGPATVTTGELLQAVTASALA